LCTLTNPDPTTGSGGTCDCGLDRDCDGGVDKCMRTKASCYFPPDCPPAVRKAASSAQCVEASPAPDLSDLMDCACGSPACATACDGEGIVLGQSETLGFTLPWNNFPGSGSLGLMVRARGSGMGTPTGTLTVSLFPPMPDGNPWSLDSVTLTGDFADSLSTTLYSWTDNSGRPTSIQLATDTNSSAEVDCVVPYLAP
jgi:hypothetical protein